MNEQLKQLAIEAGLIFTVPPASDEPLPQYVQAIEAFAKLVAKDCMSLCLTSVGNGDYNRGRMDCHDNIREVFGVQK